MVCSYSLWETRHGSWTQYCVMLRVHRATKWHLLSFPQHSSCCFPKFCWLFLAADAHWADDLRQLLAATSGLFPGPWWPVPSSASTNFGLDYFPLCALPYVCLHWNSYANSVPFVQFCEILQYLFDCPKEVSKTHRCEDFVHSPFCRLWKKTLNKTSLSKHPLLPPLHHQCPSICLPAFNLLSVKKWTFPSNTWLRFFIDHQEENKIQGFWRNVEMSFSHLQSL